MDFETVLVRVSDIQVSVNVLADSGYFVRLFNPRDHHHARCESFFSGYPGQMTTAESVSAIWALMDKYEDLPMDFCDASLVVLATSLGIFRIATTDRRDFSVYRLPGNRRFVHIIDE